MHCKTVMVALSVLLIAAPALGSTQLQWPRPVPTFTPLLRFKPFAPIITKPETPPAAVAAPVPVPSATPKLEAPKLIVPITEKIVFRQPEHAQPAPQQPAPQQPAAPKQQPAAPKQQPQQQQKFATCTEVADKLPGFSFTSQALAQCPELLALQQDPNVAKTFFIPSDKAIEALSEYTHMPVTMLASPKFKGLMCSMLKYHVVDGVHLKKNWTMGQKLTTMYKGAELTVSAVGQKPQVTTTTGVQANIKKVVFCANSVVFATDAVLTPIKIPKLGLGH